MINISISPALQEKCPNIVLSCIECEVNIAPASEDLLNEIKAACQVIQDKTEVTGINKIPAIADSRQAYKALGKDPSRYRLSAEALTRRIVKGKGLYHINNVVDVINLTSFTSGFSIGGYNVDTIQGDVLFSIGKSEPYEAIGRGKFNIEYLPTFRDEMSVFGTPTSDSTRTMITNDTTHFLMVIISFDGNGNLEKTTNEAITWLENYADAKNIQHRFI